MCGIAGFIGAEEFTNNGEGATRVLDRMCRIIAHRGPDDQGMFVDGSVALGMRRLSIIDLAGGAQPLSGCDRAFTIVFNGEVYNFLELQRELEAQGHHFHTRCDTEAVIHAFEQYGPQSLERLRGMFAFAIWNAHEQELFIARDRAGKKPLYYTVTTQGTFIFGSELKALREHPEFSSEINVEALDAYLTFGYVPDPLTIFKNVQKLPPGHHLRFKNGRIRVEQYWDFEFTNTRNTANRSESSYVEELRSLLDEAVRLRLVSDVPLGAFLSGGIDSSAVVGLMARHTSQTVKTFSIGFREDSHNELKYARLAAKHFRTEHRELIVTPDVCNIVDELIWHFDEPFADQSAIPTYLVSKLAREHVKVVLSGDGGDELFAGYTRYALDSKRKSFEHLPRFVRDGMMQSLSRHLPHGAWGRNYIHKVAAEPLDRYIEDISIFTRLNKPSLYSRDFQRSLGSSDSAEIFRRYAAVVSANDSLDRLLYLDSKTYLPGDILTKVDRMSMAVSLEARVPLLDHKLIEFVTGIPASLKMKNGEGKYIFKRAVEDIVPAEILHRPKQGFGVPISEWINQELRQDIRDTFADPRTRQRGYFEASYVDLLLDEHERGRRDHSWALWALLILERWQRTFTDNSVQRTDQRFPDACEVLVSA